MQQQQPPPEPPVKRVAEPLYRDPVPPQQQSPQSRYYQPAVLGSATAGMHGVGGSNRTSPQLRSSHSMPHRPAPQAVQPGLYSKVVVTEPLLLQSAPALFGLGQPPHWSYQVTTELASGQGGVWMVRRRFRHVVALEDRLRDDCPGAILPPRYVYTTHNSVHARVWFCYT
jgi:hypothetical protein